MSPLIALSSTEVVLLPETTLGLNTCQPSNPEVRVDIHLDKPNAPRVMLVDSM